MKLQIIALRDIKANVYGQPMFVPNIGAAIRNFGDQVQDPNSGPLHKHPEDFELWHLGEYDDNDGSFYTDTGGGTFTAKQLAVGSNFRQD